jgi:hypothetical protein
LGRFVHGSQLGVVKQLLSLFGVFSLGKTGSL